MQPVPTFLSSTRDVVLVRGAIAGGSWNLAGLASETSFLGQQSASIAALGLAPAFGMQGGAVYIRDLELSSSGAMGINATGGTLRLEHITVDGCKHGGILLDGAAFDIEDTTVSNNMIGTFNGLTNWGGMLINNPPSVGPTRLNLLTVEGNVGGGVACSTAVTPVSGILVSGNTMGVDINPTCGFSPCGTASQTCGAQ
jgi:hypothetical protein